MTGNVLQIESQHALKSRADFFHTLNRYSIAHLFLWLFASVAVHAADINVSATVDRNEMRPGDTFTYSISVSTSGSVSLDDPKLPDLSAFEIVNTWVGSEIRATFINGQVTPQKTQNYKYMLSATREGKFTIGAAEINVGGQLIRTNPITIEVTQNAPDVQQQQNVPTAPDDVDDFENDIFSQLLKRRLNPRGGMRGGGSGITAVNPNDAFFIHVEVDKKKVYQGEPVIASWYLVTRAQIADIDTLKYPALTGFWKEDIEVATRLAFQPEIINGITYQKARLASYALFPIKPGVATIDPYQAKCRVISANVIGLPQETYITKQSDELKIEVMPLPNEGKTDQFTGGVGDFVVSATVDVQKLKANTPLTLKLRIEGVGNAKMVDMPKLNLPEYVQIYDTKSEMKYFVNGRSYKEFETILVPRQAGEFKIPGIAFMFFNPQKKTYYTQTSPELTIQVEPGQAGEVIPSEKLNSPELKSTEKKIILPGPILSAEESGQMPVSRQLLIWLGAFLLAVMGLAVYGYRELGRREKREDVLRKVKRRVSEISIKIDKNDWRATGVEATNLIYAVIGEIAGLGGASYEFDKLVDQAPPSFKRTVAPQLKVIMSKLEIIGFAPENLVGHLKDKKELKKILNETEKLLIEAAQYDFSALNESEKV